MSQFYTTINVDRTAQHMRELRKSKGLSAKRVAELIGVSAVQSVYDWESGKCFPDIPNFLALSRVYGTTINSILICDGEDAVPLYEGICGRAENAA